MGYSIMKVGEYSDWLKEKVMCDICKREISRGHIHNHLKSKIHIKNARTAKETTLEERNKTDQLTKTITICWD